MLHNYTNNMLHIDYVTISLHRQEELSWVTAKDSHNKKGACASEWTDDMRGMEEVLNKWDRMVILL